MDQWKNTWAVLINTAVLPSHKALNLLLLLSGHRSDWDCAGQLSCVNVCNCSNRKIVLVLFFKMFACMWRTALLVMCSCGPSYSRTLEVGLTQPQAEMMQLNNEI